MAKDQTLQPLMFVVLLHFFWTLSTLRQKSHRKNDCRENATMHGCCTFPHFFPLSSPPSHTLPFSLYLRHHLTATMSTTRPDPVTPFALKTPLFNKLAGKRVILASSSLGGRISWHLFVSTAFVKRSKSIALGTYEFTDESS